MLMTEFVEIVTGSLGYASLIVTIFIMLWGVKPSTDGEQGSDVEIRKRNLRNGENV